MFKLSGRVRELAASARLTCRPLDAIGVDLDGQNEEEGAGVHRVAVLVHFESEEERGRSGATRRRVGPIRPPMLSELSLGSTGRDRAERLLQTDVRVNSSGKRLVSRALFSLPVATSQRVKYRPGALKWTSPASTSCRPSSGQPDPDRGSVSVRSSLSLV